MMRNDLCLKVQIEWPTSVATRVVKSESLNTVILVAYRSCYEVHSLMRDEVRFVLLMEK